ncbi:MAG: Bax inhibitor-1/YccA family protein, partial [Xanthomonadales bacterium]|nr:Bax inhibitor-1/YccA family protein [Xanthomonadales bacterium]
MEMKSTNPVLRNIDVNPQASPLGAERMTINGTIGKTFVLLALVIASGAWTWSRFSTAMAASGDMAAAAATVTPFLWGGMIAGFVLAMITIFKRQYAGFTAPLYALAQGLFLGAISAMMELRYPGIVMQAVMLTMAVLVVMLLAYRGGWIRVTDKFRTCVVAATGAVALLY